MGDPKELAEQRVFQIDRECYVIFIGTSVRDVRPFLRIGNTPDFPQRVAAEIRDVVLTDRMTGNPLFEADSVSKDEEHQLRYLGDPDIVERFKDFVGHEDIEIEAFETYSVEESAPEKHALVYFYKSGNMSVYYGADKIFALEDRERRDVHFVEEARRIKNEYLRDPLRLQKSALSGPGVLRSGSTLFFFRDGKLAANRLPVPYFRSLATHGIDPDQVHVWALSGNDTDEAVHLFKRARAKNASLTVLTENTEPLHKLGRLFSSGVEGGSFRAEVHPAHEPLVLHGDEIVQTASNGLRVSAKDLPGVLELTDSRQSLSRDASIAAVADGDPTLTFNWNDDTSVFRLIDGVPHNVSDSIPSERTLASSYISVWAPVLRDLLPATEMPLVDQLEAFFSRRPHGQAGERAVKAIEQRVKTLKRPAIPMPLQLFLYNARSLSSLIVAESRNEGRLANLAEALETLVPVVDDGAAREAPCTATVVIGSHGAYAFYRPLSATMSARNIQFGNEVRQQITTAGTVDESVFGRDRAALAELIDRLRVRAGKPTLAEEAAETSRASEETEVDVSREEPSGEVSGEKAGDTSAEPVSDRVQTVKPAAAAATSRTSGTTDTGRASGATDTSGMGTRGSDDSSSNLKRIGIAALLLLALGIGYLLAPFGEDARTALVSTFTEVDPADEDPEDPETVPDPDADEVGEAADPDVDEVDEDVTPETDVGVDPDAAEEDEIEPAPDVELDPDSPVADLDVEELDEEDIDLEISDEGDTLVLVPDILDLLPERFRLDGAFIDTPIRITDIIQVTNEIAVGSGYRSLGDDDPTVPDPNWIFPNNGLRLPDGETHVVQPTDSMWNIATAFIRDDSAYRIASYVRLLAGAEVEELSADEIDRMLDELALLRDGAYSSELAERFEQAIAEITTEREEVQ